MIRPVTSSHCITLAEVAQVGDAESFGFALRHFLDAFYAAPDPALLTVEPQRLRDVLKDGGVADSYLAAVAEFLCEGRGWPVPAWSLSSDRMPDRPWFALSTPEGRLFLLTDSPSAFRRRHLFVGADALTRA